MSSEAVMRWLVEEVAPHWRRPPDAAVREGCARLAALDEGARLATADRLRAQDVLDALPLDLQRALQPDPVWQSARLDGDRIYTTYDLRLPGASLPAVRRATFDEPWHWWGRGRVSGWTRTADGGLRFVLWPAWLRSPSRVGIAMSPPAETTGADGRRRVASGATFFADFEGLGRYEVVEGSGTVHLRSVWDGVRRLNFLRLLPASLVLDVHVNAERGTLSFPFPPGTGFGGLARHLGLSL